MHQAFWSPYYKIDIAKLEAVQRRMTKIIQEIRNLTYKDTLKPQSTLFRKMYGKGRSDRSV